MPFTEQEAKDMRTALNLLAQNEAQAAQAQQQADLAIALSWYDTLGIDIQTATTRTQAQINHDDIESLLQTETDVFKRSILVQKLEEANQKVKAVKKVNPNS